jgi:hypothetical protein
MKHFYVLLVAMVLSASGCGYHVAGRADALPKNIHTIAVPAFGNLTTRYKLTDKLPGAITREFATRTRYKVIQDEGQADAVLRGAVTNYLSFPIVSDQATGRAGVVQMSVYMTISLYDRATGKVIYTRPNFEVRERYEISSDPIAYFEESDVALERLSRSIATSVVSAIVEAF